MPEQALGACEWRAFRLFLSSLADDGLNSVREELAKELAARQDCEDSLARLLFSSLTVPDLNTAGDLLQREAAARVDEHRLAVVTAPAKPRRRQRSD
jgi:hypothetical protein